MRSECFTDLIKSIMSNVCVSSVSLLSLRSEFGNLLYPSTAPSLTLINSDSAIKSCERSPSNYQPGGIDSISLTDDLRFRDVVIDYLVYGVGEILDLDLLGEFYSSILIVT